MGKTWSVTALAAVIAIAALVVGWIVASDNGLGRVSSVMTALSLAMSVYVAIAVTEIRRRYIKQGILNSCLIRLKRCSTSLQTAISKKNPDAIVKQVTRARRLLQNAHRHLSRDSAAKLPISQLGALLELTSTETVVHARDADVQIDDAALILELELEELEWDHRDA